MIRRWLTRLNPWKTPEPQKSRIEYLLEIYHDWVEGIVESWGGIDKAALIERQIREGEIALAASNLDDHIKNYFGLANLYWGQGDIEKAKLYLSSAIERHERYLRLWGEQGPFLYRNLYDTDAEIAALLLEREFKPAPFHPDVWQDDSPRFFEVIMDCCRGGKSFEMERWQACEDAAKRDRWPKYMVEEMQVYRRALTGDYSNSAEMLADHERMWKAKASKNPESGLLSGYYDNDLIIDYLYALVLQRIGWEGRYRHSWPTTATYESVPETTREPDRFVQVVAAPPPAPSEETGIIEDGHEARRFIDGQLAVQVDDEGEPRSADRQSKQKGKVAAALKEIGWTRDPASLDFFRTYDALEIFTERSHLYLCDPVRTSASTLKQWTSYLAEEFDLSEEFIAIAGSEERSDYMDPDGLWYVLWKKDRKVYAVDREEWHDAKLATKHAQLGVTLWPNYLSFIAWWISGESSREPIVAVRVD